MATISILGMYNLYPTLFDAYAVPIGMDKELLVQNILAECAELESLYTEPVFLASIIGFWSRMELPVWQRMYNAMQIEYNPIENYNRTEDWTTDNSQNSNSEGTTTASTERQVSAFNSSNYENAEKNTGSQTGSNTNTSTGSETRHGVAKGNIGVTTTQKMLSDELSISERGNIYRYMIESFKHRFCILVY